jgi:tetratricopeptide (TPR) repeat protein
MYGVSLSYLRLHNLPEAIKSLDSTLNIKSNSISTLFWRGIAYKKSGKSEESYEDFKFALNIKAQDYQDWYYQSLVYYEYRSFPEALYCLNKSMTLKPDNPWFWNALGNIKRHGYGDLWGAISSYNEAIEINPRHLIAICNRGHALNCLKYSDDAVKDFKIAEELNCDYPDVWMGYGGAFFSKGDYLRAIEYCEKALFLTEKQYWLAWKYQGEASLYGVTSLR